MCYESRLSPYRATEGLASIILYGALRKTPLNELLSVESIPRTHCFVKRLNTKIFKLARLYMALLRFFIVIAIFLSQTLDK